MANVRKYGMIKPCRPNGGMDLRWQRMLRKRGKDANVLRRKGAKR